MFARRSISRAERRGIVLVVILGMLGLLAVIGVTFATLSGQARINARNYMQAQQQPDASELMDFALAQLIGDTGMPTSAIRGHSLKRDMYGNDAHGNGFLAQSPVEAQYYPSQTPPNNYPAMNITGSTTFVGPNNVTYAKLATDVPAPHYSFYNADFTRWYVRLVPSGGILPDGTPINQQMTTPAQTFEVVDFNKAGTDPAAQNKLVLTVAIPPGMVVSSSSYVGDTTTAIINQVTNVPVSFLAQPPDSSGNSVLATGTPVPFVLDGRYLRAFNGPGMDALGTSLGVRGVSKFANFRVNGGIVASFANGVAPSSSTTVFPGDPDGTIALSGGGGFFSFFPGMDEDYDACDLENWFLAMQSADGQVIIPSFHRPGILQVDYVNTPNVDDWQTPLYNAGTGVFNATSAAKFLRPRNIDGHSAISFPDLKPDVNTGQITYDIDNDGDGQTDSVWLDLGYSPRRDPSGKLFKPLFAFMVIGLNGRMPLNTVGNLSLRNNAGSPAYQQATHLGNSPSEIDPTWALQNASSYATLNNGLGNYFQDQVDNAGSSQPGVYNPTTSVYTPGDGGISVALTQLRNLLTGTRVFDGAIANGDVNFAMTLTPQGRIPSPLPNNVADAGDVYTSTTFNNVSGIQISRGSRAIPGRWGDEGLIPTGPLLGQNPPALFSPGQPPTALVFQTPVAAGLPSYGYIGGSGLSYIAGTGDDNLNVYDPTGQSTTLYDAAGGLFMPVERVRRFVTPIDATGDGQVLTWDDNGLGVGASGKVTYNNPYFPLIDDTGPDGFGRTGFFKYYRPPGIAQATASYPNASILPFQSAVLPDLTNNLYHGFEGARNPKLHITPDGSSPGYPNNPYYYPINPIIGGMPFDNPVPTPQPVTPAPTPPAPQQYFIAQPSTNYATPPPTTPQTFDANVFNYFATGGASVGTQVYWPYAIGGMNEPDEVSLYDPNPRDAVFGPADLEWLYRQQDTDGASLSSRLAQLAPISFTNAQDGTRRRRLFSLETWEPTNFVWANDNPLNSFANNSRFPAGGAPLVPQTVTTALATGTFVDGSSASFQNLRDLNTGTSVAATPIVATTDPLRLTVTPSPANPTPYNGLVAPYGTPSVAHRDRKINLNFPLPVSNSPLEPVRQKWIRETYQLLKAILPPKSIDTPEELAQLSQYVVNIIDFRDPDCTMTRFVNTDLTVTPATATSSSVLNFTTTQFSGTNPFTSATPVPQITGLDYNPNWPTTSNYLVQYGMEYPPVAINEVLGFRFKGNSSNTDTTRMFVEIVNTLTESGINIGGGVNACDLDLRGWDFVVVPDDGFGRPDRYTGQIPVRGTGAPTITSYPLSGPPGSANTTTSSNSVPGTSSTKIGGPASPFPGLPSPVPALNAGTSPTGQGGSDRATNYYYVFGGGTGGGAGGLTAAPAAPGTPVGQGGTTLQTTANDKNEPQMEAYLDMTAELTNPNTYYWVYLRRPPNPFDDSYIPSQPNENRVVVDSFRFYFSDGQWTIDTTASPPAVTKKNEYLYSLERVQPFRGGQMIASLPATTPASQVAAYGYSEQTTNTTPQAGNKGFNATPGARDYTAQNTKITGTNKDITYPIGNTLGVNNRAGDADNKWDHLVFNDRDFTSVAELLMVPGCPPGLFTKQFIEVAPPLPAAINLNWINSGNATTPPTATDDPNTKFPANQPDSFDTKNPTSTKNADGSYTITAPAPLVKPHTYPYLVDKFFYSGAPEYTYPTAAGPPPGPPGFYIGGPSGAGWFKMFEFFDVPSPAINSTGMVAQGNNFDWFRQDRKPGLLNINLIIDEEVFLGLMGFDSSDSYQSAVLNGLQTRMQLNLTPLLAAQVPRIVTQLDVNGNANNQYPMSNNGAFVTTVPNGVAGAGNGTSNLKACFSDFLKIRHGGTNFLFGLLNGTVFDRPFHSLSYPDIDYTVMRPAYPPPLPAVVNPLPTGGAWPAGTWPSAGYIQDPGMKNPYLAAVSLPQQPPPIQPPPIPARRLFQVPDAYGSQLPGNVNVINAPTSAQVTPTAPLGSMVPLTIPTPPSNASVPGDPQVNLQQADLTNSLFSPYFDLTALSAVDQTVAGRYDTILGVGPAWLGNHNGMLTNATTYAGIYDNNNTVNGRILPPAQFQQADMRQHPFFRSEWMQRVTNLTTVRTHQFAVWITVGFFEVIQPGNPQLAVSNPAAAYDKLGLELGALEGSNTRYRGFFLLDRTRATGFDPTSPGDFRDVIVYRKLIE